jgi:hypothetical protein
MSAADGGEGPPARHLAADQLQLGAGRRLVAGDRAVLGQHGRIGIGGGGFGGGRGIGGGGGISGGGRITASGRVLRWRVLATCSNEQRERGERTDTDVG